MHHHQPYDPNAIDPHRPWIRDERDNPHEMNWVQTLFNPLGTSPKLHFTRAWTFMFLGRVLLYIVPGFGVFIISLAGANLSGLQKPPEFLVLPVPLMLVPFFAFTLVTEFTSWVAHVRRLADAHRSPLLAMIVLVPLMLALAGFYLGAQGGIKKYEQIHAPAPAVAEVTEEAAGDAAAAAPAADTTGDKPAERQQRGQKPPGPPQSERDMAASAGFGFAMMLWAPASFLVMLWTLLYVARMPNGGVGRFRTGSDIAQGEEDLPPSYAAG